MRRIRVQTGTLATAGPDSASVRPMQGIASDNAAGTPSEGGTTGPGPWPTDLRSTGRQAGYTGDRL